MIHTYRSIRSRGIRHDLRTLLVSPQHVNGARPSLAASLTKYCELWNISRYTPHRGKHWLDTKTLVLLRRHTTREYRNTDDDPSVHDLTRLDVGLRTFNFLGALTSCDRLAPR